MIVTKSDFKLTLKETAGRSKGCHQSELVRSIALKMGYLKPEFEFGELDANKISAGLAWEQWIGQKHPEIRMHPGERMRDNITVTVDGVSYIDVPILGSKKMLLATAEMACVSEFKFTWYSMPKEPEALIEDPKWWMYRAQVMAGCKVWDTRFGRLHLFFVNGDYGWLRGRPDSKGASYEVYDFEFTQAEVNGNWDMLMKHKKGMEVKKK